MKHWLKKIGSKIVLFIGPIIIYSILKLIFLTCKKKYNSPQININQNLIILFWHGEIAMMPFMYKKIFPKRKKMCVLISNNKDGELVSRIMNFFGIKTIRGSTSKGASKALKEAIKILENGYDFVITPDGPRGPRHAVSNGAIFLPQKMNLPIVTINYQASKKWQFKSWDKFILPKPFSTIEYFIDKPFYITETSMNEAKEIIQKRLMKNAS